MSRVESTVRQVVVVVLVAFVLLVGPSLLAQAAAAAGVPPAASAGASTANEWGNSFLVAFFSSWVLAKLRSNQRFAWFTAEMETKAQRYVALAASFIAGVGVSYTFDPHTGTLTVIGLTVEAFIHAARQFGFQEFAYQSAIKRM